MRSAVTLSCFIIGVAVVLTWLQAGWVVMWSIAMAEFVALKLITLAASKWTDAKPKRVLAYVLLWPGMDAAAFLHSRACGENNTRISELLFAVLKLCGGLLACGWAVRHAGGYSPVAIGWVGMIGIIFVLHFGLLHVISWCWRYGGVNAPPIMRAPMWSDSLAELWGGRWNAAFADAARRLLLRPLARKLGVKWAAGVVFLVSGLVHETVISFPAGGGWGGPIAYFILQGAGIAVEKSPLGKTLGLGNGASGWLWMAACTMTPLPLLFHRPFILHVIDPLFVYLNHCLS